MVSEDIITGAFELEEGKWAVARGFGEPSWKQAPIADLSGREDFLVCTGRFREESSGKDVLNFTYGPSAGGLTESVKFNIFTYGERVLSVLPEPGYKSRNIRISGNGIDSAMLLVERINGILSPFYSGMFAQAVEAMLELESDSSLGLSRIIMNETSRIFSHLNVIGKLAEGASQRVAFNLIFALREKLARIISRRFGHRYFFGINGIGGLRRKVDFKGISQDINKIVEEVRQIWSLLEESRIFIDRIQGTAAIKKDWLLGPAARASGIGVDSRLTPSRLPYGDLVLEIPVYREGDTLDRAQVRRDEIFSSARVIESAEASMRTVPGPAVLSNLPDGRECSVRTESPGGDTLMRISMSGATISDIYIRPASVQNLSAFSAGMKGNLLTDFVFGFEGLDIHVSELGVIL